MSLIKCPECGHEVSSKAEMCPHCGVKIAGNVKRCPICQRTVLMEATQCPHCQTHFERPAEILLEPGAEPSDTATTIVTATNAVTSNDSQSPTPAEESQEPYRTVPAGPSVPPKKGMPWYLLLFIIVIVALGAYLYWDNFQQRRYSEEKAFELLRECNDPLNFEDFIARYPNSSHLDEVRAKLNELRQEDVVWSAVAKSNNVAELNGFIQSHPHSPFVKIAYHKIDSLDWREAEKAGTTAAYDKYIAAHEAGEYITEAFEARNAAKEREERARRDSIAAARAMADSIQGTPEAVGIDEIFGAE